MTLIEQLEKAEEPSRELDAEIAVACGFKRDGEWLRNDERYYTIIELDPYDLADAVEHQLPAYTSSIDAALTLVPDGWCWDADASAPECGVDWFIYSDGHRQESKGTGATPALAICAAALKARENNDG